MLQGRKGRPVKQYGIIAAMTMLMALLMLPVGLDVFSHGYFCDEQSYGPLPPEGAEYVGLSEGGFTVDFSPAQKHFKGFELALAQQAEGNSGQLLLTVTDESGAVVDSLTEDLSQIHENQWYRTYLHKNLEPGRHYSLTIAAHNCALPPSLQLVKEGCVAPETSGAPVLLGYAYGKSTFSGAMKAGIGLVLALVWCLVTGELLLPAAKKMAARKAITCLTLGLLLASNYSLYYMDSPEAIGPGFDPPSQQLVMNSVNAYKDGAAPFGGYGLGDYVAGSSFVPYKSHVGLQGHVFRIAGLFCGERAMGMLCAAAAAAVFMGIVLVIKARYGTLMAGCFYITFWLSPWVVNFATHLYWVEFTWFLPMLIGLLCLQGLASPLRRRLCCAGAFAAVLIKCLCGYEYISAVMMGMIAFPLAEWACALAAKDKQKTRQLTISIAAMGVCALLGFGAALLLHGTLRGEGSLGDGLRLILEQDVLRRTAGGDMNQFDPVYWPSFNASVIETLYKYLRFDTQIITGLPGNLFPLLCVLPLVLFALEWHKGKLPVRDVTLYAAFGLAAVSWLVLAKSHSFIHTHLNFVLWYFGFVQVCFYVLLDRVSSWVRQGKGKTGKGSKV